MIKKDGLEHFLRLIKRKRTSGESLEHGHKVLLESGHRVLVGDLAKALDGLVSHHRLLNRCKILQRRQQTVDEVRSTHLRKDD